MREGQVLSETYDDTKPNNIKPYWDEYIKTDRTKNVVSLKKDCSVEKLCRAELDLICEIYDRDKNKSSLKLRNEHHRYPEWINPGHSSIPTDYEELLRVLGKNEEQIEAFRNDMCGLAYIEEIAD